MMQDKFPLTLMHITMKVHTRYRDGNSAKASEIRKSLYIIVQLS